MMLFDDSSYVHLICHAVLGITAFAVIVIVLLGDCLRLLRECSEGDPQRLKNWDTIHGYQLLK